MNSSRSLLAFKSWLSSLKRYGGYPAKGTISGALVVLQRLGADCDLSIDAHTAEGGSQIIGASGNAVRRILIEFGETRPFVSEGGRTNRGLRGDIKSLLDLLRAAGLGELDSDERERVVIAMQRELVEIVSAWHDRQRIEFVFDETRTTRDLVSQILHSAKERNQVGPVAQYLVGAKLQLRYPHISIENDSFSTSDAQLGRGGDFVVGDTAFHVTVSPMDKVYERCQRNLRQGMKAYLLVPASIQVAARTNADSIEPNRISVESIESFVGGNVDELACFSKGQLTLQLRALLETYNSRVSEIEVDKSMLIEIPHNLNPHVRKHPKQS